MGALSVAVRVGVVGGSRGRLAHVTETAGPLRSSWECPVYRQENARLTAAIVAPPTACERVIVDVLATIPKVMAPGSRLDIAGDQRSLTVRSVRVHRIACSRHLSARPARKRRPCAVPCSSTLIRRDAWYPQRAQRAGRIPSGDVLGTVSGLTQVQLRICFSFLQVAALSWFLS